MKKNLFLFFHINITFSSIKVKDRSVVIKKCYWPILNIAEKKDIFLGLEINGRTLELISQLDKKWIEKLKILIKKNKISLIGSGYCQIIGPLVPYKVNMYNYKIGNEILKKILNVRTQTVLVNEHCFSKSLIDIFKSNKFNTMIMEWENSKYGNKNFSEKLKFKTAFAKGFKNKIKVIWNSSLYFQNFQKFVYGNTTEKNYLNFINKNNINSKEFTILYGSDTEIFNFRPRKTSHNPKTSYLNEWKKIESFLETLKKNYNFLSISEIKKKKFSNNKLIKNLTSTQIPCTTKKQEKYNITRWALTGNNDYKINTECFKIYKFLNEKKIKDINQWKKLCYFWSSDFRTHIEKNRWIEVNNEISKYLKKIKGSSNYFVKKNKIHNSKKYYYEILSENNNLIINYKNIKIGFNLIKGLTLDYYYDYQISDRKIIGSLDQGFYFNQNLNVDYFSGHFVSETLNKKKITDVSKIVLKPSIKLFGDNLEISQNFKNSKIIVKKKWSLNLQNKTLSLEYIFKNLNICETLRHSIITINPKCFNKSDLFFSTHNGGNKIETFKINKNQTIDHAKRISHMVSAATCQGMTEGKFIIGDNKKKILINTDNSENAVIPMIQYYPDKYSFFYRLLFSSKEHDDTSINKQKNTIKTKISIKALKS